ncbi:pirin family protein [Mycolicibacter senuensis]|uniref:Putative quercetin 2,3-dioxygenase n=1 Tax=Mycolicibacter senuensis TaxID=386913 RepID=A0A7I9XQI3_9MYCO|nr:pirin-like bicupin family protein [Mycolicibacter senuensis]MDQ2626736.1 pirin family protein [Actinomycetota bacterium]ORW70945.1 quercetin 2,3-dioxygenase [Mycolicibacter senuensis]GFG71676.1 putative quercetin 2,3-dioxygenase [Mycolicibacter senuensis]
MTGSLDVRRAADRAVTRAPWLTSRHSFSFNDYYDPDNTHHGLLLVNNDDVVEPAAGFDTHPHRDAEIVTWVLSGELTHRDSLGNSGVIRPGLAQRMSAGTGVRHSERNESATEPVHFVQMWIMPDTSGRTPGYQQQQIGDALAGGGLVTVASGSDPGAAIAIGNAGATLYAGRLQPGDSVELPDARYVHLFVAIGRVDLEGAGELDAGDAVRLTGGGGQRVRAETPAEILIWQMHAALGG